MAEWKNWKMMCRLQLGGGQRCPSAGLPSPCTPGLLLLVHMIGVSTRMRADWFVRRMEFGEWLETDVCRLLAGHKAKMRQRVCPINHRQICVFDRSTRGTVPSPSLCWRLRRAGWSISSRRQRLINYRTLCGPVRCASRRPRRRHN